MKQSILFLALILMVGKSAFSQVPTLSEKSKVSLLTCAAGDELYYAFGHSAFRVQDPTLGIDVVYNYGTFDFNRPNFYLNFVKGKLIYSLSRRNFDSFLFEYELEKRWVKEQIFDLSLAERNEMLQFFENNYLPENRDYLYDPLLNNCSSIVGDILIDQFGDSINFDGSYLEKRYTFRELVRQHLKINSWSAFGIDLAFGSVVDRKATLKEHMFLPYYAMKQIRNTTKDGKPLLERERIVLDYGKYVKNGSFAASPLFWFILLFLFTGVITYVDYKHKTRSRWLDFSLFLITGLIGLCLMLLWLATDHTSTPKNFNVLWAVPFHIFIAFVIIFQKQLPNWFSKYIWFAIASLGVLIILWIAEIQVFSPVLVPILLTMAIRYGYLLKFSKP
ncbi:DUF4105 domain-containing protein [Muricauda aurantiaca]|nr:DUF4105 domain-containing protein [Allomuricauda aurantiaca]